MGDSALLGTAGDWLASLKGEPGEPGKNGEDGISTEDVEALPDEALILPTTDLNMQPGNDNATGPAWREDITFSAAISAMPATPCSTRPSRRAERGYGAGRSRTVPLLLRTSTSRRFRRSGRGSPRALQSSRCRTPTSHGSPAGTRPHRAGDPRGRSSCSPPGRRLRCR